MNHIPALHRRMQELGAQKLQDGVIVSFTHIQHPPIGFGQEPYAVALIQLTDGSRVCAQLTREGEEPKIGASVKPHIRRIRTMENGLFVNDVKYEVMHEHPVATIKVQQYVLALTGPSGVGKSTVTRALLRFFQVSSEQLPIYTTQKMQGCDNEPYVHVTEIEFEALVERGDIIAHSHMETNGRSGRYGYSKKDILRLWEQGKLPVVATDIRLLQGLAKHLGRRAILSCGLLPPGNSRRSMLSALLHRLRMRGNDSEHDMKHRLKLATSDLNAFNTYAHLFDHIIINDDLELCVENVRKLVPRGQE